MLSPRLTLQHTEVGRGGRARKEQLEIAEVTGNYRESLRLMFLLCRSCFFCVSHVPLHQICPRIILKDTHWIKINVYGDCLKKHIVHAIKLPWDCWKNSWVITHTFIALGEYMEKEKEKKILFYFVPSFYYKSNHHSSFNSLFLRHKGLTFETHLANSLELVANFQS